MVEPQLIDYIKKAKAAGQSDEQTRALLYKNGWTETEVVEAFSAVNQPSQQPEAKPQPQPQIQRPAQPQQTQPRPQPSPAAQSQVQKPQPLSAQQIQQTQTRPQPQPQAQPQDFARPSARKGSGVKVLLKLAIIFIIVAILGVAGLYVGGQYVDIPWNPFVDNPKAVIAKMAKNMKTVKSSHLIFTLKAGGVMGGFNLRLEGDNNLSDKETPKSKFNFDFGFRANDKIVAEINADAIVIGDRPYFKLNRADLADNAQVNGANLKNLTGKWFLADEESLVKLAETYSGDSVFGSASLKTPGGAEWIQDILSDKEFFSEIKTKASEKINGQSTLHYVATVNTSRLKEIILAAVKESMNSQATGVVNPGFSEIAMAEAFIGAMVDMLGPIDIEMWIGRSDKLLYAAQIKKDVGAGVQAASIDLKIENSNFNKPVDIQAPQSVSNIEEILNIAPEENSAISSGLSAIGIVAQETFAANKNFSQLCYKGLLNGYLTGNGSILLDINNSIVNAGGSKPACFAAVNSFCVSTKLGNGTYACIDKNGLIGASRCVNAQTVCQVQGLE